MRLRRARYHLLFKKEKVPAMPSLLRNSVLVVGSFWSPSQPLKPESSNFPASGSLRESSPSGYRVLDFTVLQAASLSFFSHHKHKYNLGDCHYYACFIIKGSLMTVRENPPSKCTRISSNIVINGKDNVFNIGRSVTLACPSGALDSRLETLNITLHLEDPSKYYELIVRRDLENDVMFGAPVINLEPSGHYFKKPLTLATKLVSRFRSDDLLILHGFKAREGTTCITWHDITHTSRIDEANSEVVIEIYHFSLIAILLRLGRSTLLCTRDIVSRLNLVPFNYALSVLLKKSNPSSVHDELALLFVSQDVYCEQFYREDETWSALMQLKNEGFVELHVRSSQDENSIYNNETLKVNIILGEDYKLANSLQESTCFTVNSYDWWHVGEVMRIPLEWTKDVRSLCGKVRVTGEYGHTSERHFSERGQFLIL